MSFHPQTPQSPSQFSPNGSELASMNTSMTSVATTLPTPAHSVSGSSIPSEMAHDVGMGEDSPQKRKRPVDDLGGREQKKVHIEDGKLSMNALHQNVGEKYLLCRTQHKPRFPDLSEDLYEQFNLTGIASAVARVRPDGSKNSIRKTYKGFIKELGVNGRFDAVSRDWNAEDGLSRLIFEPEDSWLATKVKSKEIWTGLSHETTSNLRAAFTMAKGPIPKSEWDNSVLGDLALDKVIPGSRPSLPAKSTAPSTPLHPGVVRPKGQQPLAHDPARPRRNIKKRGYGDSSFEGYGEGFPDDDGGMASGYSTGEGDDRGGQKRRKKNPGPAQFSAGGPVRQQSYGPGMVGA